MFMLYDSVLSKEAVCYEYECLFLFVFLIGLWLNTWALLNYENDLDVFLPIR